MSSIPRPRLRLPAWADRLGAWGAFICALHCALVPVALALLPAVGLGLVAWHGLEWAFTSLATVLAVGSYFAFVYALNLQFPVLPWFLTA